MNDLLPFNLTKGLNTLFAAPVKTKSIGGQLDEYGLAPPLASMWGASAPNWGAPNANTYAVHAIVYSVVSRITEKAAALPWGVYKVDGEKVAQRLNKHPLIDLMYRPNPVQSWADLIAEAIGYLLTTGNAYFKKATPGAGANAGKTKQLWVVPSGRVAIKGGGFMRDVTGYEYTDANGTKEQWTADEVVHVKYWNPADARYGLSPIAAGARIVTAADAGLASRVTQYQNQGPASIIYQKGGDNKTPWTQDQVQGIQTWLKRFVGGTPRQNVPVTSQELGVLQLGLSPVDLDVLEAMQADKRGICDLFAWPATLMNDMSASTESNVKIATKQGYTDAILPNVNKLVAALNRGIGEEYKDGAYMAVDTSGVPELQEDKQALATLLNAAWWIPVQEKQKAMGIPEDDTLPRYLIPAGLVNADELTAPPAGELDPAAGKAYGQYGVTEYTS